jgi:hypothetical protein
MTETDRIVEQAEARFAYHPTLLHLAKVLIRSRERGVELTNALSALDLLRLTVNQTTFRPGHEPHVVTRGHDGG